MERPAHIRSVTVQAINYFSRSHAGGIRREPISSLCAWEGADLMADPDRFEITLDAMQIEEVRDTVRRVAASGVTMGELVPSSFAWPLLRPVIDEVKAELLNGLGFKLIRGLPTDQWSPKESEYFFMGWGLHLGICGAQDDSGEILEHVRDTGADPKLVRQYKTRGAIDYHCDAADAVGLMCVSPSKQGGESTLVSSAAAYNRFLKQHPNLVDRLYAPFLLDVRGSGGINCVPVEPLRHGADGRVRTFWHNEYFRSCYGKQGAPAAMDAQQLEAWAAYDAIIHDPSMAVTMTLRPGDVQMCSNHTILHARTAYEDDPLNKRHLLRLWLSFEWDATWADRLSKAYHTAVIVSRFLRSKAYARLGVSW